MVTLLSTLAFLVAGPWLFSLYFVFAEKPLFIPADYSAPSYIPIKEYRIQQRPKNKKSIIIISGSNSLFGISSPVIEHKTDYNIYNFGINAGFPLCLYMYFAEKYAQKGDIIIAPLEYGFYTAQDKLTPKAYAQISTWAMPYTFVLPDHWQKELKKRNIRTYWQRLPNLFRELPIQNPETTLSHVMSSPQLATQNAQTNRYGERLQDKKPEKNNFNNGYFKKQSASAYFKNEITAFRDRLAAKGISLYITFPVSEKQSKFDIDTPETQDKLQYYREQIESCGINFFGTDSFYNLENKYFFNSHYHLNATGSILRSLLLAEDINMYVLGKEPSYDHSSPEAQKAFFEQQEQEALRIIEALREEQRVYEEKHSIE